MKRENCDRTCFLISAKNPDHIQTSRECRRVSKEIMLPSTRFHTIQCDINIVMVMCLPHFQRSTDKAQNVLFSIQLLDNILFRRGGNPPHPF